MKVRLIKRKSIEDFALQNARSRSSFRIWLTLLKQADWNEPGDIADTYGSADLLGNGSNRVVFDIAGNNYRICGTRAPKSRVRKPRSVSMARGKHPFPCRTRQLSLAAVTILGSSSPGKIARCRII